MVTLFFVKNFYIVAFLFLIILSYVKHTLCFIANVLCENFTRNHLTLASRIDKLIKEDFLWQIIF